MEKWPMRDYPDSLWIHTEFALELGLGLFGVADQCVCLCVDSSIDILKRLTAVVWKHIVHRVHDSNASHSGKFHEPDVKGQLLHKRNPLNMQDIGLLEHDPHRQSQHVQAAFHKHQASPESLL